MRAASLKLTFLLTFSLVSFATLASLLPRSTLASSSRESKAPDILDALALKDGSDGHPPLNPCLDFYRFSCGRWIEHTQIPPDKEVISHQSTALLDHTDEKLNQMLANFSQKNANAIKSGAATQLGDYYSSCLNFTNTARQAKNVLKTRIRKITEIRNLKDLARVTAQLQLEKIDAFFSFGSGQDLNDSARVIGFLGQGGMGLPEPDFYSKTDLKSIEIRQKYLEHIKNLFLLLGESSTAASHYGHMILTLESELALHAYSLDERSNPSRINHPMNQETLKKLTPSFDWDTYFAELIESPNSLGTLNVNEPEFFMQLERILKKTKLSLLKQYLIWQLTLRSASAVNSEFDAEYFSFWHSFLHGEKQMKPRWKRCTQAVEKQLGYALAEAYVSTIEVDRVRSKIEAMILGIKQAFHENLKELTTGSGAWMDPPTMQAALNKLTLLGQKLGAPTLWRNYTALITDRSSFLSNDLKVSAFETRRDLAKINKPVDRTEWEMMPWEINAYYDPSKNEFVFPFGILQPPSFDVNASDGANLGAFGGGTIGHELTHGYDNDGRQYDGNGTLKEWWTPQTKKLFEERSQCFIKQASTYKIEEVGLNVNGKLTLPENLADQGGVKLGYLALRSAQSKRLPAPLWLNKYSENQQYWIAYAQGWCMKRTPEGLRSLINTNEHPPEEFRVNGVVMNRPEFAHDFGCHEGDPMAPVNRCSLW